jgi:hypothetical protein
MNQKKIIFFSTAVILNVKCFQMIEEGYPIPFDGPMKEKYKHFVLTK